MSRDYIETGVEWINSIPSNWKLLKVKNCFYISKKKAQAKNPTILKLARDAVKVRDISTNEGQIAASYDDYNPVFPGDFLLNPMDLYSGANCNVSEVEGVISPAYINLRKTRELNPKYFDYYFKAQYWTMAMFAHGKGVSFDNRWTINVEGMKNYEIPFPNIDEQNKIVAVINKKCSQIDELIAIQEQEIEKLKAYKQSLITEIVTKGLDHNAEMKESGVDRIGKTPSTNEVIKLKYITTISRGLFNHRPRNDPRYYDGTHPFVQTGDVARAGKYINTYSQTLNDLGTSVSKKFPKGTMTMTIAANIGDIAILNFDAYFPDSVLGCSPKKGFDQNYIYYVFCSLKEEFLKCSVVSTQLNLNVDRVKNIEISVTRDILKQKMIADYLDQKSSLIDHLVKVKQFKIIKLNDYRKSLIYEYVTGKKEIM